MAYRDQHAVISMCGHNENVCSGNKIDENEKREIPTHIGQEFADRYEMCFVETSAKDADNVDHLFSTIAHRLTNQAHVVDLHVDPQNSFRTGVTRPILQTPSCCKL